MKEYTYSGAQASFAMRTSVGSLTLRPGIACNVAMAMHEVVIKSPIVQALIENGEITVSDVEPKAKSKDSGKGKQLDASGNKQPPVDPPTGDQNPSENNPLELPKKPTMPQLKKQLDDAGIAYAADASREQLESLLAPTQDN